MARRAPVASRVMAAGMPIAQPRRPSGRISSRAMAVMKDAMRNPPGSARPTLTCGGLGVTAEPTMSMKAAPQRSVSRVEKA